MPAEEKPSSPLGFDLFELDPSNYQLRRRGMPVELPPQALRILILLAARPDELVTRKEIKDALWPGQSFGDFDSRLNFTVKKLREALGDDAERPRYIKTVRNAGYRFIAPVTEAQALDVLATTGQVSNAQAQQPEAGPSPLSDRSVQLRSVGAYLAAAAFILIVSVAAALLAPRQSESSPIAPERAGAQIMRARGNQPRITSVSSILPVARQRIVISGRGFGLHVPYARTDSPYLRIGNETADWEAGHLVPHNWDEVMLDVESWSESEIVITGFSGDYGKGRWKLNEGDELEIAVWNPQNGDGPALYKTKVVEVK